MIEGTSNNGRSHWFGGALRQTARRCRISTAIRARLCAVGLLLAIFYRPTPRLTLFRQDDGIALLAPAPGRLLENQDR